MNGELEPIVGRYVHVEIGGVMHRIYFEKADRASRWSACIPRAPTTGSGAICSATPS